MAEAGPGHQLHPVAIPTLGGWHPEAHRGILSLVTLIASRTRTDFAMARSILVQRHAALLVRGNALCLLSNSETLLERACARRSLRSSYISFRCDLFDFYL